MGKGENDEERTKVGDKETLKTAYALFYSDQLATRGKIAKDEAADMWRSLPMEEKMKYVQEILVAKKSKKVNG